MKDTIRAPLKAVILVLFTLFATDCTVNIGVSLLSKDPLASMETPRIREALRKSLHHLVLRSDEMVPPKRPDEFVIGIFGGSVADQMAQELLVRQQQAPPPILAVIEKSVGRKVRIADLASSGGHEPLQFNRLHMVHDRIDLAVFLDGFNDMFRPSSCHHMVSFWSQHDGVPEELERPVSEVRERLEHLTDSWIWSPLRFSGVFKLYLMQINNKTGELVGDIESGKLLAPNGPGSDPTTTKAQSWGECEVLAHEYATREGIPILFFLQPNQYVKGSKPLSVEERTSFVLEGEALASHKGYEQLNDDYAAFNREVESLRARGLSAYSLTGIFQGVPETVYKDSCCHLNTMGSGVVAEAVLRRVAERLRSGVKTTAAGR